MASQVLSCGECKLNIIGCLTRNQTCVDRSSVNLVRHLKIYKWHIPELPYIDGYRVAGAKSATQGRTNQLRNTEINQVLICTHIGSCLVSQFTVYIQGDSRSCNTSTVNGALRWAQFSLTQEERIKQIGVRIGIDGDPPGAQVRDAEADSGPEESQATG